MSSAPFHIVASTGEPGHAVRRDQFSLRHRHDIEWAIRRNAALGLQSIEPYENQIEKYRRNPMALKRLFDDAGIAFIDASKGEAGESTEFVDPARISRTIVDHVEFARDYLHPLGATHWKCNMAAQPPGGPSDDQLKKLADTLNEIGRQTFAMGIRMAPASSHMGTYGTRARGAARDRAHRSQVRLAVHGHGPPDVGRHGCRAHHGRLFPTDRRSASQGHIREVSRQNVDADAGAAPNRERLHNLGGGGVDFPAVFKLLGTGTTGARSLDLDGPRKGDDGFDAIGGNIDVAIDDYIAHNINYLRDVVGVRLPPLD